MLACLSFVRGMGYFAVFFRLLAALICGGCIGMEREVKRRPAGFRTHVLICLGAAITTLTSQYLFLNMHLYTDVARLGAQVISGIGFIGAGTIIVTRQHRVMGLTTAAGLWTAAVIGLVCGAGYIECAIVATISVLIAELLLIKLEYRYARKLVYYNLLVEYTEPRSIEGVLRVLREQNAAIFNLEVNRQKHDDAVVGYNAVMTIKANREDLERTIIKNIHSLPDIKAVEEL